MWRLVGIVALVMSVLFSEAAGMKGGDPGKGYKGGKGGKGPQVWPHEWHDGYKTGMIAALRKFSVEMRNAADDLQAQFADLGLGPAVPPDPIGELRQQQQLQQQQQHAIIQNLVTQQQQMINMLQQIQTQQQQLVQQQAPPVDPDDAYEPPGWNEAQAGTWYCRT